jgi:hypothetical protein
VSCAKETAKRFAVKPDNGRRPLPPAPFRSVEYPRAGQHRFTQRRNPGRRAATDDIVALARRYGRYGYRKIA